jgi:hypothetical protein
MIKGTGRVKALSLSDDSGVPAGRRRRLALL